MRKVPLDSAKPLAAYYDDAYAASDYWEQEQEAASALQKIVDALTTNLPGRGLSLLDIGCGPGLFLGLAQQAGFDVTGVELNQALAEQARRRTGAEVLVGELEALNFEDRRFDVITLLDLIEHVADPIGILKRCHDLLKPGGHVVLYTPNHKSLIVRIAEMLFRSSRGRIAAPVREIFDGVHVVFFDVKSLKHALGKAGFDIAGTNLFRYDPARSGQAKGVAALMLKSIEMVSPIVRGQFRILMFGRKAAA